MTFIAGKLLVASRHLRDPNFAKTVVFMLEHSQEGALGVVLNRPSAKTVRQVWQSIGHDPVDNDQKVFLGGPVPGPLIALHPVEELGEKAVLPGLFMSVQGDVIEQLVRTPEAPCRLYSGHAGWGSGQLEGELRAGGWHTTTAEQSDLFYDVDQLDELWPNVLRRIALQVMLPGVPPDRLPPDPNLN